MKKNVKYIIIILIVLLLIISIVLFFMLQKSNVIDEEDLTNATQSEITSYKGYEFQPIIIDSATLASMYLNDLKINMLYNVEEAYNKLDDEYKQEKYPTLESFNQYIENNMENIQSIAINKYEIKRSEKDSSAYKLIIIDKKDNYYIFDITAVMQYNVILDTYTLDLPEFLEEYNNAQDSEKVLLNLQKVFEAINDKDYHYVYNKLDDTFRTNNFPTEEEFEEYMANTFFDNNSVSYEEYQTRGNIHIYKLVIKNKDDTNAQSIEKEFIMQLGEGTDFVMSFNV